MLFFFNDTATTEIYTLSLHDALPISIAYSATHPEDVVRATEDTNARKAREMRFALQVEKELSKDQILERYLNRSEEHTSELQSRQYLVCRLLLEKKKTSTPTQCRTTQ